MKFSGLGLNWKIFLRFKEKRPGETQGVIHYNSKKNLNQNRKVEYGKAWAWNVD